MLIIIFLLVLIILLLLKQNYEYFTILNDEDLLKCFSSKDINTMDYSNSKKVSYGKACCYLTPTKDVYGLPILTWNGYYLNNMCVDPLYRKKKHATKLLKKVFALCKKENKDHIILYVERNNKAALNLYQKNDFRIYQNLDKIIIMVKNL